MSEGLSKSEVVTIAKEVRTAARDQLPGDLLLGMIRDAHFIARNSPLFRSTIAEIPMPKSAGVIVYVAGPMSGLPDHNVPAFDAARDRLQEAGFATITPPDITRSVGRHIEGIGADGSITEAAYLELVRLDLRELTQANAMVLLPGWRRSKGAKIEYVVAVQMGLPVYTLEGILKPGPGHPLGDIGHGHAIVQVLTEDPS